MLVDDQAIIEGPVTFEQEFPLEEYPVYIREGAIIPMHIEREYTKIGDESYEGYLTMRIYPGNKSNFTIYDTDTNESTKVESTESDSSIEINLKSIKKKYILQVKLQSKPKKVSLNEKVLEDTIDYTFDKNRSKLIIKSETNNTGKYIIIK